MGALHTTAGPLAAAIVITDNAVKDVAVLPVSKTADWVPQELILAEPLRQRLSGGKLN